MSSNCQLVVFSNKAYNAIIRESFDKDPVETGGILLGHVLDNGVWVVMEVLPPGINSVFQYAYFEYDESFVNYLAQSVANQYKLPLDLLGLWHRHPGSMDFFSNTDDGTNITFARQSAAGAISALVNIDPQFRITMYHLDRPTHVGQYRPKYDIVEVEVGDDIIPEEFFELRYFNEGSANLHPTISSRQQSRSIHRDMYSQPYDSNSSSVNGLRNIGNTVNSENCTPKFIDDFFRFCKKSKYRWIALIITIIVIIGGVYTYKLIVEGKSPQESTQVENPDNDKKGSNQDSDKDETSTKKSEKSRDKDKNDSARKNEEKKSDSIPEILETIIKNINKQPS